MSGRDLRPVLARILVVACACGPAVFPLAADRLETEYAAYEAARKAGEIPRALKHARAALDLGLAQFEADDPRIAVLSNNLAELYSRSGETIRARDYYDRALKIYRKHEGPRGAGVATVHNNLGRLCEKGGRLAEALLHYRRATEITLATRGETDPLTALRFNNLAGVLLARGEKEKALLYYRRALTINIERLGREHPRTARTQANLAGAYRALGNEAKAERYYRLALESGRKQLGPDHPDVALRAANLGGVLRSRGDLVGALRHYRSAVDAFRRGGLRDEYLHTLKNMSLAQEEVPNYEHAAATLRGGIEALLAYRLEIGRGKTDFTRRHGDLFQRLFLLALREGRSAEAFEADMLRRGLSIAEGLALPQALERGGVPAGERDEFLDLQRELGLLRSRRAALLNAGLKADADRLLETMLLRERRQTELDARLVREYPDYALYRKPYIPRPAELRARLAADEIMISYNFTGPRALAFVLSRDRPLIALPLGRDGRARSDDVSGRVMNLHELLAGDAEDGSRMCPCFRIRRSDGSLRYWNQALPAPPWSDGGRYVLEDGVVYLEKGQGSRVRAGVIEGEWFDGDEVPVLREDLRKSLFADLIAPVLKKYPRARRLVIVPDGAAYYLPFGLLADGQGRLLMQSHALKTIHSPVVWYRLRTGPDSKATLPLFGVGNAVYAADHPDLEPPLKPALTRSRSGAGGGLNEAEWSNLPGTLQEIRDIARLAYGATNATDRAAADGEGTGTDRSAAHLWHGRAADRARFLEYNRAGGLRRYRLLHFSLHGLFVDGQPDLNALVFSDPRLVARSAGAAGGESRTDADRFLRLGDVKTLRLDAELVVMSACETSLGLSAPGEGMIGLPQGFLIAGSRNVLATLWAVDDTATREIMRGFYRGLLREKLAPAEALRRAQLAVREKRPDPFYWAAFALYGD